MRKVKPYYGWYITVTLAVTETISWGIIYYAFTVFITPMEAELGWTRTELTGAFSLMLLVTGVIAFPVGAWIDKHGARLLMTIGAVGASVLVILWSQVTSLTGFYLIWAGLGVCAASVLYEPAFAVIAQWFHQRRSTALAVVTFAAGLASTIFLPLADTLMQHFGWRTAVLILGLFLACMTIPLHAFMLRRHPSDLGLLPDGAAPTPENSRSRPAGIAIGEALRGRAFWLLTLGFGLGSLSAAAIRVHFIPFLIDSGIESSTAAFATGAIGVMQVIGRIIFAPLDHRYSTRSIIIGIFGLQTLALMLLLLGQSTLLIGTFICIFGASQGAATLARPSILAELYGVSHYGRISSVLAIFLTVTTTAAPLGAGLMYDQFESYSLVLVSVVILAALATGIALITRRQITSPLSQISEPATQPVLD